MSAAIPVFPLYDIMRGQGQLVGSMLAMNGLETYVGKSDCKYITRLRSWYLMWKNMFKNYVFDEEKYVQKLCKFCPVTFCSI
jgi:hypothetical protein